MLTIRGWSPILYRNMKAATNASDISIFRESKDLILVNVLDQFNLPSLGAFPWPIFIAANS